MPATLPTTEQLVAHIAAHYEGRTDVTTADVRAFAEYAGLNFATVNRRLSAYKSGRGRFNLDVATAAQQLEQTFNLPQADAVPSIVKTESTEYQDLTPATDDLFVSFGCFKDVKTIGNGKTHAVEQACAQTGRDLIRVNVTIETDSDDLLGGFRLVNGETVWHNGPVVEAMERGAVLLLDEVDLSSNKIMCLQSVLEGKGVYLKKINRWVTPAAGFTVIATANTRGKGDESGQFIGANVLNEAFLERFAVTLAQDYPTPATEIKILTRNFAAVGAHVDDDIIRRTYADGGVDSVITTRRLINIAKAVAIWGDVERAIELCTNRFDDDTRSTFTELYSKMIAPEATESASEEGEQAF
jgi:MoxR-like ATPase